MIEQQVQVPTIKDVLNFLHKYLEEEVENEERKIIEPIQCDYDEKNDEAYCVTVTERKQKKDWLEIEDPQIMPDGTRDWRTTYDTSDYGQIKIRYVAHPKGTEINVSLTPRFDVVNKRFVFTAKKSSVNYSSNLEIIVDVKRGQFQSMNIYYNESETYINGYYRNIFEITADPDLIVKYEKNFATAQTPPNHKEMKAGYNINYEVYPEYWEDEYVQNLKWVQKWIAKKITISEARQMLSDLIDFYDPDNIDNPENGFVKGLINFVKEIINSDDYEINFRFEDLSGD